MLRKGKAKMTGQYWKQNMTRDGMHQDVLLRFYSNLFKIHSSYLLSTSMFEVFYYDYCAYEQNSMDSILKNLGLFVFQKISTYSNRYIFFKFPASSIFTGYEKFLWM